MSRIEKTAAVVGIIKTVIDAGIAIVDARRRQREEDEKKEKEKKE